jgi:hypothetical protein
MSPNLQNLTKTERRLWNNDSKLNIWIHENIFRCFFKGIYWMQTTFWCKPSANLLKKVSKNSEKTRMYIWAYLIYIQNFMVKFILLYQLQKRQILVHLNYYYLLEILSFSTARVRWNWLWKILYIDEVSSDVHSCFFRIFWNFLWKIRRTWTLSSKGRPSSTNRRYCTWKCRCDDWPGGIPASRKRNGWRLNQQRIVVVMASDNSERSNLFFFLSYSRPKSGDDVEKREECRRHAWDRRGMPARFFSPRHETKQEQLGFPVFELSVQGKGINPELFGSIR